jgi:CCR4-NOT transcriptional regulation complex NOT5 subunit
MDSFIFLVDLAYISPPPEADTKTNGLSSRSYKTSSPSTSLFSAASRRAAAAAAAAAAALPRRLPSNANVKHRRGELTFSASCQTGNRGCISPGRDTKS